MKHCSGELATTAQSGTTIDTNVYVKKAKGHVVKPNIFNGRFVLGKYITPLKGKTGMVSGNFFIKLL
mgnify:CR=1 FL=1